MQKIEINTTQNVIIQYDLASLQDRILAFLLDAVILFGSIIIISIITSFIQANNANYLIYFVIAPVFFFYSVLFEIINDGQSIGKKALHIRVVKTNGIEAELSDFLVRWVFRSIEIYFSFGSIAAIFISSSDKNQRLGDLLANTTVIKVKPAMNLGLKDIMNISTKDNYDPKYPAIRKLKEEEMLVVKSVIERVRKYPNESHFEILKETVEIIKTRLGIETVAENDTEFLKILIKDYIVLTR